jgi:hypothetical protein
MWVMVEAAVLASDQSVIRSTFDRVILLVVSYRLIFAML